MEISKEMELDIKQVLKENIENMGEEVENKIVEDLLVCLKAGIIVNHNKAKETASYIS